MIALLGKAIITFAITNIDDLLILSVYFGNARFHSRSIVAGQYLGIVILVLVSLVGILLGSVLENHWLSLLGIVPVMLGIKDLLFSGDDDGTSVAEERSLRTRFQFLNVAFVTIANGGDNIGVYMPLFANLSRFEISGFVIVFLILTGVWCGFAYYLTRHPLIKDVFARYGKRILPYFLIVLGIDIMWDFLRWVTSSR
jgi:cadmium resistance protein CadD (predicted permease)